MAAVRKYGWAFRYADISLQSDRKFQYQAFKENFNSFIYMIDPPQALRKKYNYIINKLRVLNITFPERLDTKSALEIIKNRENLKKPDSRPIALFIYPKKDFNGVFVFNKIRELIDKGYRVFYYEARKDTEYYQAVRTVGKVKKIATKVIGGHGVKGFVSFGASDPAKSSDVREEVFYLDLSDASEMKGMAKYMEENSVIIVDSCSTGEGGEGARNVANMLRGVYSKSELFSPRRPSSVKKYTYDENNRISWVDFYCGNHPQCTYYISPTINNINLDKTY